MQHLLGLCGMRWDLQLAACGATPARAAEAAVAVPESAARRAYVAGWRRMGENAAARDTAAQVADRWLTVRERRAEIKAARLAERARQATAYSALVQSDDETMRAWLDTDLQVADRLLGRCFGHLTKPPAARLPVRLGGDAAGEIRRVLEALSRDWPYPSVALTGATARAVWSPARVRRSIVDLDLAPLRGRSDAITRLIDLGAVERGGSDILDLGGLTIRLRASPPPSTTLVRWRPGFPVGALSVARPEWLPGMVADRHTVRAVLSAASRDKRGRRYPPYHETLGVAVRPVWFEPGCLDAS